MRANGQIVDQDRDSNRVRPGSSDFWLCEAVFHNGKGKCLVNETIYSYPPDEYDIHMAAAWNYCGGSGCQVNYPQYPSVRNSGAVVSGTLPRGSVGR